MDAVLAAALELCLQRSQHVAARHLPGLRPPRQDPQPAPPSSPTSATSSWIHLEPDGSVLGAQRHVNTTITALLAARHTCADLTPQQRVLDDLHATARATLTAFRTSTAPPEPVTAITLNLHADNDLAGSAHHDRATHIAFGTTAVHLMLAAGPSARTR